MCDVYLSWNMSCITKISEFIFMLEESTLGVTAPCVEGGWVGSCVATW
jgi:hypothetical protein